MDYYYYIVEKPYINGIKSDSDIPVVYKLRRDAFPVQVSFKEMDGPFNTVLDLRKKSIIFSTVRLEKHRQRILKSKNIREINDQIMMESDTVCEITFIDSLYHTMVGEISKQKVTGLHFYNPDRVQIVEKIKTNDKTKVYSARIKKFNENTGEWIEKDQVTTFFPDHWSVDRLFHECLYAYNNKIHISGMIYESKTISGVAVKFVINEQGKILTIYPEIDEN